MSTADCDCEWCADFSGELLGLGQRVYAPARVASHATALVGFVQVTRTLVRLGPRRELSGGDHL